MDMPVANTRFVWHDLLTTTADASMEFYGGLLGWEKKAAGGDYPPGYSFLSQAGNQFAGIYQKKNGDAFWRGTVKVTDADATLDRAVAAGGEILYPAADMPGVGRCAILRDPQGLEIAIMQPAAECCEGDAACCGGPICWNQLVSADPDASAAFYQAVFGWQAVVNPDMPDDGVKMFVEGEAMVGSLMKQQCPDNPTLSLWVAYLMVDDVDATWGRIGELGGQQIGEPMDIPYGRIGVGVDPQGAIFGLFTPAAVPQA